MNRKRKFLIVSVFLVIIIMISIMYKIKCTGTEEKNNDMAVSKKENVIVNEAENVIQENIVVDTTAINENKIEEEISSVVLDNIVESTSTPELPKQEMETTVGVQEVVSEQEVIIEKPVNQLVIPEVVEEPKLEQPPAVSEPIITQPVETVPTEEYRYNDSMTQTMVSIINNNPSDFMKADGFSVVVDSSITSLTNQFTFTEERVKNKIAFKAGTIRVYAQDYYYNGELLFTECYIF